MPRASTTSDVFNAIAEPRRRDILDILSRGEGLSVNQLIDRLRPANPTLSQPTMSKHLGVLRKVGLVSVSKQGQHRIYRFHAQELQMVHEWIKTYERFWTHQIDRIKERAERKARERAARSNTPTQENP